MIVFGDNNIVPYLLLDKERYFVLNFFNPTNIGDRLDGLWAPPIIFQTYSLESYHFDMAYANFILQDDNAFVSFMEILMAMYYNEDVFILTDLQSPPVIAMCETIIKLIQQRYGYNCYIANDPFDVFNMPDSDMSEIGNHVFMQDKERYTHITVDAKQLLSNIELVGGENDKCV